MAENSSSWLLELTSQKGFRFPEVGFDVFALCFVKTSCTDAQTHGRTPIQSTTRPVRMLDEHFVTYVPVHSLFAASLATRERHSQIMSVRLSTRMSSLEGLGLYFCDSRDFW
jgi:hypothetical protein